MEEDDPVVQEIPVYISQALSEHLYIYQYPVQQIKKKHKDLKVRNVSMKPKNQLVRMELEIDTYGDHYCASKGEQIALNTDGPQESRCIRDKEKEKSQYFKSGMMDKIVYESTVPCTDTERYAIAILQDKELHCTPIKGILQFRPSYSHYDKQDKRKGQKDNGDNSDDEEKESDQVNVKFKRIETDFAKKAREKSFAAISQRIADEPWYDTLWKKSDTDHADLERMKLFSATTQDGSSLTLGATEYIKALFPQLNDESETTPFKKLSLQDQIKETLINAKLMTFTELHKLVRLETGPPSEAALLAALRGTACCVRGVWAPRSRDLYTRPAHVPARLMCAARDHVLYLLTHHSFVDRRKIAASVRLPSEDVLTVLRSVAKFKPNFGWELLIPPDTAFEAKYPDVVEKQNLYWEARQRQFTDMLIGEPMKRQRKKSQRDSIGSDTMMSPKARKNSVSEEDSDKRRHKKSATGGKRTRKVSSSSGQDM
ncbi:unnamed protein product [Euphydryas editha]|uniref:DNA-directed RNA polymerase III subunit RPC5 n=1 Tax=Euphydryas editha TaxID=104508 RepID=A0AAU9V467_EUPED|nr:unnamed protein product [Euphydryas editha]